PVGIRDGGPPDPCDQADPRPVGRGRMGAGLDRSRAHGRAARRVHEAAQVTISERLAELGVELPAVVAPLAAYVPAVRTGNLVYTSGQLPMVGGELPKAGKVGAEVTAEEAKDL